MNKKTKTLSIKAQFSEAKTYVRKSKEYIYYSIIFFLIFAIFGFFFRMNLTFIDELLKDLIDRTSGLNLPEMIFFILQNNLQSALLSIIAGIFLGFIPLINIISNGTVIGYVLGKTYDAAGLSVWWHLLPHGVFELPAIFISFGLGLNLGYNILRTFLKHLYKKSKIILALPSVVGIFLALVSISIYQNNSQVLPEIQFSLATISVWIFISISFLLYSTLAIFYYILEEKFRRELNRFAKPNIYNSLNAFLFIIVPLLIIAAIVEGALIILLG